MIKEKKTYIYTKGKREREGIWVLYYRNQVSNLATEGNIVNVKPQCQPMDDCGQEMLFVQHRKYFQFI